MKYLEYKVSNMAISRIQTDKTALISGAVNYFGMRFELDPDFAEIPGTKAVEFIKKNNKERRMLVDGKCEIPNWILTDKDTFQIRVISGNVIGTPWFQVSIAEGGIIMPEEPEEDAPENMEYVKTESGAQAVPYLRALTNGLEYSKDGSTWESGVSGVPDVPKRPEGAAYLRMNGDWVEAQEYLKENGTGTESINSIKVDGTVLPVEDGSANIDLSAYAKTADSDLKYATKEEVQNLQVMTGMATELPLLDYSETDPSVIASRVNDIILALQTRGVAKAEEI